MLSERFKTMYRQLGLDRIEAAKFLLVSERTLHNWESGKHEIPYSAYKLLRLQTYQELPGTAWRGWSFSAGCLWSPEGHAFKPADSAWWSLLCRRSANFGKLYDENRRLQQTLRNASKVQIVDQVGTWARVQKATPQRRRSLRRRPMRSRQERFGQVTFC